MSLSAAEKCILDCVEDDVLGTVARYVSFEEVLISSYLSRRWREVIKDFLREILEGFGICCDSATSAYIVYMRFYRIKRKVLHFNHDSKRLLDGVAMCTALNRMESIFKPKKSILMSTTLQNGETKLSFAGESWSLRLVTKRIIRIRNAQDSGFSGSTEARPDDHHLALELQLLPYARCYPNCNCRYSGQAHFSFIPPSYSATPSFLESRKDAEKKISSLLSIELTGCYSWRTIPSDWYINPTIIQNSPIDLLVALHCCTADWAAWASLEEQEF